MYKDTLDKFLPIKNNFSQDVLDELVNKSKFLLFIYENLVKREDFSKGELIKSNLYSQNQSIYVIAKGSIEIF